MPANGSAALAFEDQGWWRVRDQHARATPRRPRLQLIQLVLAATRRPLAGCRMYPYASEQHAMTDVLRLSRGLTYKAICELPYGGGKSVMIAAPRRDKTPALLHAMGRIIEGLGGRYITADDVGTTLADLVIMREVTRHAAGATAAAQQALPVTAFGVFEALRDRK